MDYMEMMIENNKKLFAGEVPFYVEEPTYPEIIMVNSQMMNTKNYFQEY